MSQLLYDDLIIREIGWFSKLEIFGIFSIGNFLVGYNIYIEWSNVERPVFRNFKITNIKITKVELFFYLRIYFFIF